MRHEETLDPENWQSLYDLGHRIVDDMLYYLETVRDRPVWKPMPAEVRSGLDQPLPTEPQGPEQAYEDFRAHVLPYPTGNIHPRFWGWVIGTGTPFAMLTELMAAGMNPNTGGFDDASSLVEAQVIAWCREMLGFGPGASGLLVSGASMANLLALAVARNTNAGFDVRLEGLSAAPRRLTLYGSSQIHSSIRKAVELLGLGSDALRTVPVDAEYRIDVEALRRAITADRAAGYQPFCVVGSAGTVNTGAFDDLSALADVCEREGLWLHVDGAFGAMVALAPALAGRTAGVDRAHSLTFDLHKWGYLPIEVGGLLVRREEDHRRAFAVGADYLGVLEGGPSSRRPRLSDYGLQLSRGFKALKVWMSLKAYGTAKLGRLVQQNVDQAQYLAARIQETADLELLAPAPLNIVCFRYVGDRQAGSELDRLNERLLVALQELGIAVPSHTVLGGRFALRVAVTNHRSRREDFDLLVSEVVRLGRRLSGHPRDETGAKGP